MIEGISKETLLAINPWDYDNQQDLLNAILELCTELDPWLPIDENTPKDVELLFPGNSIKRRFIGYRDSFNLSYYDQDGLFIH